MDTLFHYIFLDIPKLKLEEVAPDQVPMAGISMTSLLAPWMMALVKATNGTILRMMILDRNHLLVAELVTTHQLEYLQGKDPIFISWVSKSC